MPTLVDESYYPECVAGLYIAGEYPFECITALNNKFFDPWGSFGALYWLISE